MEDGDRGKDLPTTVKKVYILLGSNMGDRRAFLETGRQFAIREIGHEVARSLIYESEPWGLTDQDTFLNQVICLETDLDALSVLKSLQEMENRAGRNKISYPVWGPRQLDGDMLIMEDVRMQSDELTLPHAHLRNRRFALVPLAEIAGDLEVDGGKSTIRDWLSECPDQSWVRPCSEEAI